MSVPAMLWKAWRVGGGRSRDGPLFPGAEHCRHNSAVSSWKDLEGDDFTVTATYEVPREVAGVVVDDGRLHAVPRGAGLGEGVREHRL